MAAVFSNSSNSEAESVRQKSDGCWTGWLCDMDVMKSILRKTMPDNYLESYPRSKAIALNTWLSRFGLYSNGMSFELDRYGSVLAKDLIKYSSKSRGYQVRIDGSRNGDKIRVTSIVEIIEPETTDPDFPKISQQQLRGEFAKMGI